jgi:hypothetical protein
MFSALNLWNDMIDVLCVLAAVLAQVLVPQEDRSPRQRHGAAIRNRHVAMEPYDRWDGERLKLGMPCTFRLCNHNGALPEQQHKSPSCRYDRQRLVRSVENQGSHRGEIVPPSARTFATTMPEATEPPMLSFPVLLRRMNDHRER